MNTLALAPLPVLRQPLLTKAAPQAGAAVQPATTWLERLAQWADRQPPHRRLGSWTVL
jgi:hypothetical protein